MRLCTISSGFTLITLSFAARAETIEVGPGKAHGLLSEVVAGLAPGDVVQIDGGNTYQEDVSIDVSGITIRGIPVNGQRPVLSGSVHVSGDHIVLENLEIRDGAPTCLTHGGHDLVVRDTAVHDCPNHGILGTDVGSGSLLLERIEVYNCASVQTGNRKHQIYIATDEVAHPGAVFRMELSYVHDCGSGGSNVKSRAERTELYSNWIENGGLYELELYGPDEDGVPSGWTENLAREDSDVVGNVFHRAKVSATSFLFRFGGDGDAELDDAGLNDSKGRVRFAYNTVIATSGTGVFKTFNRLDSIEAHNNVFFGEGGGLRLLEDDARWIGGSQLVIGDHNWVSEGTTEIPAGFTATLTAGNPELGGDFYPVASSMLIDAGASPTVSPAGHEFPNPLSVPLYHPSIVPSPEATFRPMVGNVDIGAFEYGDGPPQPGATVETSEPEKAESCSTRGGVTDRTAWMLFALGLLLLRRQPT